MRKIKNGRCCEGKEMKEANLPVRPKQWKKDREKQGNREREGNSAGPSSSMREEY